MPCESHESRYLVGDDSAVTSDPMFTPFNWNCTPTTSRSSTAVAVRSTVPASVVLPVTPGENSETMGGATSGNGFGCAAFHCATALFQYCRPAAPVITGQHSCPLNVVGNVAGNGPDPSH